VQEQIRGQVVHPAEQQAATVEHRQEIRLVIGAYSTNGNAHFFVAGALSGSVKGKRVLLIDDSIVRGNTIGPIIKLLRNAGATEVHIRVASPPLLYPCYMGINIPTREELIANKLDADELAVAVGANSLKYLSVEGLIKAVRSDIKSKNAHKVGHCTACLTGEYPGGEPHKDLDW
jgi:amidophosphoribosyltransferase